MNKVEFINEMEEMPKSNKCLGKKWKGCLDSSFVLKQLYEIKFIKYFEKWENITHREDLKVSNTQVKFLTNNKDWKIN